MTEPTITCPKCKAEIRLTESLAAPLIDQQLEELIGKIKKQLKHGSDAQALFIIQWTIN